MEPLTGDRSPRTIADRFEVGGDIVSVRPLGEGHINATYAVATDREDDRRYVLQRINRAIFRNPEAVIRNAERIVSHVRPKIRDEGGDPDRECLTPIRTQSGQPFARDPEGDVWRCCTLIEGASAHSTLTSAKQVETIARAFGRFLRHLGDYPPGGLEITLPGLHDTLRHLDTLREAARTDPLGRAPDVHQELALIEEQRETIVAWAARLASRDIPVRAVHNDTKINNVLVDNASGHGICVIDLDTVMPGSAVIDIGDCARSALTRVAEPGQEAETFSAVIRGYLAELGSLLTDAEIEQIVPAARAIAVELGSRFLADHLTGDRWFPVARPSENLDRARGQLQIARHLEMNETDYVEIVRRAAGRRSLRGTRSGTLDT